MLARPVQRPHRLGGHVGGAGVLDQLLDMRGGRHVPHAGHGRPPGSIGDLPVEHLDPPPRAVGVAHQDAPRRQTAVDHLLLVGEADHLGGLPQQIEPHVWPQPIAPLGQEVVQAEAVRVVLEDDGGADLVLGVAQRPQHAGVLQRLGQLEVAAGGPADHLPVVGGRLVLHEVEADAAFAADALDVAGLPVLAARPLLEQPLQQVVADPPLASPVRDAGLLDGLADDLG